MFKRNDEDEDDGTQGTNLRKSVNDDPKAHHEPTMRDIFKPAQRIGKDNSAKPAPKQPMAKQRFKIGKE